MSLGDLKPGMRVGDYTIEGILSARGSGVVYRATHVVLPRRVTIKVLPAATRWMQQLSLQLMREACIVEALDHPGVPRVYECGVLADRRPWVASELVEGVTLADALQSWPMSPAEVAGLVRDVAEILAHAHRRGVVHGHVTPEAIILPDSERRFPIALSQWSDARACDSVLPVPLLTPASARAHQAPELRNGGGPDGSTDVYSLGVAAYRALHGTLPTRAPTRDVPPMLAALVTQMLASEPAKRPTAEKVSDAAQFIASALAESEGDAIVIDTPGSPIYVGEEISTGVPVPVGDVETVPTGRTISSEHALAVVGEIDR